MNQNYPYGSGPYYQPQPPKKKGIGTGGIIAIILVSCFALMLLVGSAVVGSMLLNPDSRFSIYTNNNDVSLEGDGRDTAEGGRRPYFGGDDDGTEPPESESRPETEPDTRERDTALPETDSETEVDRTDAERAMDQVTRGENGSALSTKEIYRKAAPSVVGIVVATREGTGTGSGIIMTEDGYILTNAHVVEDAISVTVTTFDGKEYPATVLGSDESTDVAVIRIDASGLMAATFGNSDSIEVGEDAIAIGNPLGMELSFTITKGIVSAINRNITIGNYSMTVIQTDASINPGNSGGPLLNSAGEVVGITSAKIMSDYSTGSVEGIGFAIPINSALDIARDLAVHGRVTGRPYLGIMVQTQYINLDGEYAYHVVIVSVEEDSPAEKAGLRKDDVILTFNGAEIEQTSDLLFERDKCSPGDTVKITVYRNGKEVETSLTLIEAQS